MDCEQLRDAISARLDGEDAPAAGPAVGNHLEECAECARFAEGVQALHRTTRLRSAEPVPDLVGTVLARVETPRRRDHEWARYALFAVALTHLVLALPALVLGDSVGASVHIARELGSWDVALAVGLLYAAWRPERAAGLLPFAVALAAALAFTAVLDVTSGRESAISETHHLLELVGVGLLALVARPGRRPTPRLATA